MELSRSTRQPHRLPQEAIGLSFPKLRVHLVDDNQEAVDRLQGLADCFLVHNRAILLRCDDSVVRVTSGKPRQLRRSRGFVPVPIFLKEEVPAILAVGSSATTQAGKRPSTRYAPTIARQRSWTVSSAQ